MLSSHFHWLHNAAICLQRFCHLRPSAPTPIPPTVHVTSFPLTVHEGRKPVACFMRVLSLLPVVADQRTGSATYGQSVNCSLCHCACALHRRHTRARAAGIMHEVSAESDWEESNFPAPLAGSGKSLPRCDEPINWLHRHQAAKLPPWSISKLPASSRCELVLLSGEIKKGYQKG